MLNQWAEEFFTSRFGAGWDVIARGPGRVNLIGEHTDYNDGFALPFAIDRSTVAVVRRRSDRRIRLATSFTAGLIEVSADALGSAAGLGWAGYPLGVVWALGEVLGGPVPSGFDVAFVSDVPVGAGLSSSAAIESAMAVAVNQLWQLGLDRRTLAKVGQRAENVVVGAPTGILDQSASLLSQQDAAVLLDCRSLDTEVVPFELDASGLAMLVVDTKVSHAHAAGGYGERRAACMAGARSMQLPALRDLGADRLSELAARTDPVTARRVRHVVTENDRVLATVSRLREAGPSAIGELLVASHVSMRDDFEISTPELDLAVETAMDGGAIGARMTGGGFGGSAIVLTRRKLVDQTRASLLAQFRRAEFAAPDVFEVRPAPSAAVIAG